MINLILKLMENEALKTAFLKLANMSISASWLVLAILVLRLVLKKAPKWVNVLLWGIVAVRLICPFTIESALSLIPSTQTIPMNIEMAAKPAIDSGVEAVNSMVNPIIAASFTPNPAASANPLQIWIPLAAVIWAFGMVLMFLYTAISYWRLNRRIDTAVRYRDNIFQCEHVSSPFVLGIIKPKIYLPFHMNEQDLQHVVAHEQAHILRKDHWWKPLGFLLLTVYWFNPLMWVAYVLLCRDIELACDEKVIEQLNSEQRANYTQALVASSVNRRMISACPLAFGEVDVKERVKSIMNYRKPTFLIIVVSTVACAIVAICFLTNPVEQDVVPGIYGSIDSSKWNISLEVSNVTPKGATIKLIQDGGYLPNRLFYGDDYNIEKYENSQWTAVEPLNDLVWATIAYTVPLDDSITWNINWSNTFGELDLGLYRFCKSVSDHRAPGVTDHEVYTVEFIISDGESSGKRMLLAKVVDSHDGYFLVEPVEGSSELSSASRIEVPMKNMEPSPEPQVGDILEIEYDGLLQETYPARISNPYRITVTETTEEWSEVADKIEAYLIDYTFNQVKSRIIKKDISVLSLTDNYALVHVAGDTPELIVYHYARINRSGDINITGIGRNTVSDGISINHVQIDNQHTYLVMVNSTHGDQIDEIESSDNITLKFISEEGEAFESKFQNNSFYMSTLNSPLAKFEIVDDKNKIYMDLDTYLDLGYTIREMSMMIAAIGTNGVKGFVKAEDLEGYQPSNPEEAIAYMEEIEKIESLGIKYVRDIPLYSEDGVTVIGEFTVG